MNAICLIDTTVLLNLSMSPIVVKIQNKISKEFTDFCRA